jgi:hypothetical protein
VDINLDKFPKLKALNERVRKDPGLDAWLKKRPENVFPPDRVYRELFIEFVT